jgi:gliding motility-associated-like protein
MKRKFFLSFILSFCAKFLTAQVNCNTWLRTQGVGQSVTVGDLDVTGNQITVEGSFSCTSFPIVPGNIWEEVVSKHSGTSDDNYTLRMDLAAITTTNGFFRTPSLTGACEGIILNKRYHVAMVYNGSSLKFYRNGFLLSQIPATGNLILNNYLTTIGDYANTNLPQGTNFFGYLNEIRIWNVARTQTELRTYMNASLPNPTTQVGLLGYYTFDNLINKQGNTAYNGTLNGTATINNAVTNCNFVADSCEIVTTTGCNNWLKLPNVIPSYVTIGDLDISGDQITVEATFSRDAFFTPVGFSSIDLVSKHSTPADVNYLLRTDRAEITTTNGYFVAESPCASVLNKTYHVAMVYDGSSLKFYRNGFLLNQVPASGNLFLNDFLTSIGLNASRISLTQLLGFINEVRIWNTARSQSEIRTYINTSLPNPTTQAGLLAYYTFDNLINKQGNATYNGTLNGSATINSTVTNCNYVADSCPVIITPCTIDSVRFSNTNNCLSSSFNGIAYPASSNIINWQWYFGDGGTANTQNASHTYALANTYTVKLVVTDINGCKDSISKPITTGDFVVNAGSDTSFCSNTFVSKNLNATLGASTYSWTPSAPLNNPSIPNPTATVNITTTFYVTTTSPLGCTSTDSVTIYVNPIPTVKTLKDTSICKNSILVLTTTPGLSTYQWSPGIYVSDSTIASPTFIDTVNRRLYVTGTNANGCFSKDTIDVTVLPLPVVKTINDSLVCSTNSIVLTTTGAASYQWFPSTGLNNTAISNPIFNYNQDITYYVTGTAVNGCKAVDTLNMYVNTPTPFNIPPDKIMCEQQSVMLDGANGLRVNYLWTPFIYLSNNNTINPIASPPSTRAYDVLINNVACNLSQTFTVNVLVQPKPSVVASKLNDIDCAFKTAQLQATGATKYVWSPSIGLNNDTIQNPIASIPKKYYVVGTTTTGCSNIDSITVVDNKALSLARYLPNAFTPNGDNINDCYKIKNWMHVEILEFTIFNRWGEPVFFTRNINKCWDGMYKGKKADAGSYVYRVLAKTKCGTEEQKGNILLIR